MTPAQVLELIEIASQLANVISAEVRATNSEEVEAAWEQAKAMFLAGGKAIGEDTD